MKRIENVIIIGMGAVGTLFGRTLQMALGLAHVAFLMDEARLERALSHPVLVNGKEEAFRRIGPKDVQQADLVLVTVKGPGLLAAMDAVSSSSTIINGYNLCTQSMANLADYLERSVLFPMLNSINCGLARSDFLREFRLSHILAGSCGSDKLTDFHHVICLLLHN